MYLDLDDLLHVRILNAHFVLLDVNVGKYIIVVIVVVVADYLTELIENESHLSNNIMEKLTNQGCNQSQHH